MYELVELQVQSANRAIGNTEIQKFILTEASHINEIYIKILIHSFPRYVIYSTPIATWFCAGRNNDYSDKKSNNFLKEYYECKNMKCNL